jgi:hypothetical protein
MRTISQWLYHLFWRARQLPATDQSSDLRSNQSDGLTVAISFVGRPETVCHHENGSQPQPDFWLEANTLDDAETMLVHLARLGTTDHVLVFGCDELPPSDRRRLGRLARYQRQLGVVVDLQPIATI